MSMVFCRGCAKEIHSTALACPGCGAPQASTPAYAASAGAAPGTGYVDVLKKYATFTGRASRKEFWMFLLFNVLIGAVIGFIEGLVGIPGFFSLLFNLAILIPSIAVGARRMHDTDRSGWWQIVPIVGFIFMLLDSHPGTNRFGPNPKGIN